MNTEPRWLNLVATFGARPSLAPAVAARLNDTRQVAGMAFELFAHRFASGDMGMAGSFLLSADAALAAKLTTQLVPWMERVLDEEAGSTRLDDERLLFDARAEKQGAGSAAVVCNEVALEGWLGTGSHTSGCTAARTRALCALGMRWLSSSRSLLKFGLPAVFSNLIATFGNRGHESLVDVLDGVDPLVRDRMLDARQDLVRRGALLLSFADLKSDERNFAESLRAGVMADPDLAQWCEEAPRDFMIALAMLLAFSDEECRYLLLLALPA